MAASAAFISALTCERPPSFYCQIFGINIDENKAENTDEIYLIIVRNESGN